VSPAEALAFVERHGVVLQAARGPVPSLAEAVAGGRIRGSWWGHPKGHEIFRVADLNIMRIFVNVPQAWVSAIHDGQKAELRVQEIPGKVFQAVVAHSTHAVDTTSRSMLAVLRTPNPGHLLLPGMYAQVRFATSRPVSTLLIPGDALVNGTQGTRVATTGPDGKVHFKSVRVGNDFGNEIEILDGLSPDELVIKNPTDAIREGAEVEVQKSAR